MDGLVTTDDIQETDEDHANQRQQERENGGSEVQVKVDKGCDMFGCATNEIRKTIAFRSPIRSFVTMPATGVFGNCKPCIVGIAPNNYVDYANGGKAFTISHVRTEIVNITFYGITFVIFWALLLHIQSSPGVCHKLDDEKGNTQMPGLAQKFMDPNHVMDCEMVGVGQGTKTALGRVTLNSSNLWWLELAGKILTIDSLQEAIDFLNKYMGASHNTNNID
ncbi:hypothetical protein ACFE04_010935 [Oxalis oulophora]